MTKNQRIQLREIHNVLSDLLGDTDPDTLGMTQQEVKENEPLLYCCEKISLLITGDKEENEKETPRDIRKKYGSSNDYDYTDNCG